MESKRSTTSRAFASNILKSRPLTRNASTEAAGVSNNFNSKVPLLKRKAESSPPNECGTKRSALGDISNNRAAQNGPGNKAKNGKPLQYPLKKRPIVKSEAIVPKVATRASIRNVKTDLQNELNVAVNKEQQSIAAREVKKNETSLCLRGSRNSQLDSNLKTAPTKDDENTLPAAGKTNGHTKIKTRFSNEYEKSQSSLYVTASEDLSESKGVVRVTRRSVAALLENAKEKTSESAPESSKNSGNISLIAQQLELQLNLGNHSVPEGVVDFDKENWNDVLQVSHYTKDIFNYLKSTEADYKIDDYMTRQLLVNCSMRSKLVAWMVDIQETFELNHETLYLGVKLVDIYLSHETVSKDMLQLVGATSMFVAAKYDEQIPPCADDFVYICDGAYTRRELLRMEKNVLRACDFKLGIPISYRFLRRYARTAKVSMPILTLARYILELSLLEYETIFILDSLLAAAALYLALKMKNAGTWNSTLEFYSGYSLPEIMSTVYILNNNLRKPKNLFENVCNKYSHKVFFEVAKVPFISNRSLRSPSLEEKINSQTHPLKTT